MYASNVNILHSGDVTNECGCREPWLCVPVVSRLLSLAQMHLDMSVRALYRTKSNISDPRNHLLHKIPYCTFLHFGRGSLLTVAFQPNYRTRKV